MQVPQDVALRRHNAACVEPARLLVAPSQAGFGRHSTKNPAYPMAAAQAAIQAA